MSPAPATSFSRILAPLLGEPRASAVLSDVDGTLAPIVVDPDAAAVPAATLRELAALTERFALVGCVSGRQATAVRRMVGLDGVCYIGNHGLERLDPGAAAARATAALAGHEDDAAAFLERVGPARLREAGLRLEDKGAIRALHWRGAANQAEAEKAARLIADEAESAGLVAHRGRKVLEIRPPVAVDKGTAISELLAELELRHALYAGDDRTDLDGFRALAELKAKGVLETAVRVGIGSDESPAEIVSAADLVVDGPTGFVEVLRVLSG